MCLWHWPILSETQVDVLWWSHCSLPGADEICALKYALAIQPPIIDGSFPLVNLSDAKNKQMQFQFLTKPSV